MRIKAEFPVKINGQTFFTEDISEKGCLIKGVPEGAEVGKKLKCEIELPEKKVTLTATVKHITSGKTGLSFDQPVAGLNLLFQLRNAFGVLSAFSGELLKIQKSRAREAAEKVSSFFSALKTVLIVFFLATFFISTLQLQLKHTKRKKLIHQLEKKRGTKVITLIHRTETVGFFGIPVRRFIREEDAEAVLRQIRKVPPDKPIDLIIHTPGGMLLAAFQIAAALKQHPGKVTVFVPHYAMSGGTLIALAADEIVMDRNAVLGPVDPQLIDEKRPVPAVSILRIPDYKPCKNMDDHTLILYDQAKKAIEQVKEMVRRLLKGKNDQVVRAIIDRLVSGKTTHDYPLTFTEAKKLGLPVSDRMPQEVYAILGL